MAAVPASATGDGMQSSDRVTELHSVAEPQSWVEGFVVIVLSMWSLSST